MKNIFFSVLFASLFSVQSQGQVSSSPVRHILSPVKLYLYQKSVGSKIQNDFIMVNQQGYKEDAKSNRIQLDAMEHIISNNSHYVIVKSSEGVCGIEVKNGDLAEKLMDEFATGEVDLKSIKCLINSREDFLTSRWAFDNLRLQLEYRK